MITKIKKNIKSLFPKAKAYEWNKVGQGLIDGIAQSIEDNEKEQKDALKLIVPNDSMTDNQKRVWAKRLNESDINNVVEAYAYPNNIKNRSSSEYIEYEIQKIWQNLYVHEVAMLIGENIYVQLDTFEMGENEMGGTLTREQKAGLILRNLKNNNIVANFTELRRETIIAGTNDAIFMFYLAGKNFSDRVVLPLSDEHKLRQKILQIKPAQMICGLLIDFV